MAETKEQLVATIKEWIQTESEIKLLQKEIKMRRTRKKELSEMLVSTMKDNEIDCFDINNGKIVCRTTKTRAAINRQNLAKSLEQYFIDNPDIDTNEISNFILESRQVKETNTLVIKQNK